MDRELLVQTQIEDGAALIRQLVRDQFEVNVAFWLKRTEESLWSLYVATTSVSEEQLNGARRKVYDALTKIPDCSISPSEFSVITATDPIARGAVALRDRSPSREPKHYHGQRLGKLATEEVCIYPRLFPLEVRVAPSGSWQVLINKFDDVWLTCDSEDDARTIAKACVLEVEALEIRTSDEELATELEKTADVMAKYRMGFGSRSLRHSAAIVRQQECVAS